MGNCVFANRVVVIFIDVLITYDPVGEFQLGQMDEVLRTGVSDGSSFCCKDRNALEVNTMYNLINSNKLSNQRKVFREKGKF